MGLFLLLLKAKNSKNEFHTKFSKYDSTLIKNKLFYLIGEKKNHVYLGNLTIRRYNTHKLITTIEEENLITELA